MCVADARSSPRQRISPFSDDDVTAERSDADLRAPVAECCVNRVIAKTSAADILIDVAADRHRKLRPDGSTERVRVELEPGVGGQDEPHGPRMRVDLIPTILCERAGQLDSPAD